MSHCDRVRWHIQKEAGLGCKQVYLTSRWSLCPPDCGAWTGHLLSARLCQLLLTWAWPTTQCTFPSTPFSCFSEKAVPHAYVCPEMPALSRQLTSPVQITPSLQDFSQTRSFLESSLTPRQRGPPSFLTAPSLIVSATYSDAWLLSALLFELGGHASLSPTPSPQLLALKSDRPGVESQFQDLIAMSFWMSFEPFQASPSSSVKWA